jgi:hypothetical protein
MSHPSECSPRVLRAWPLAWPLPSGPLGWQRSPALKGGSCRSFLRSGQKRPSGALDAGGTTPDNARRSGPLTATSSRHPAHSARARRPGRGAGGRGSGIRRGPQAAGHPGPRCAAAPRAVGLASEGRGESCRPATARPRVNPGRLPRVTLAAHPLATARARPHCSRPGPSGPARRRCALEKKRRREVLTGHGYRIYLGYEINVSETSILTRRQIAA